MVGGLIQMLVNTCSIQTDIPAGSVLMIDKMQGDYPCGIVIQSSDQTVIGQRLDTIHLREIGSNMDRYEIIGKSKIIGKNTMTQVSFTTSIDREKLEEILNPAYIRELLDLANNALYPEGHPDYLVLQRLFNEMAECNFDDPNTT